MTEKLEIPEYIREDLKLFRKNLDFKGKKVLEIGGSSIPEFIVFGELGARSWICVDLVDETNYQLKKFAQHYGRIGLSRFSDYKSLPGKGYLIFNEPAENIPDYFYEQFDVVISINAFEHIISLQDVLLKIYNSLRNGGILDTIFGPIWSSYAGSHFYIDDNFYFDKAGPLPRWFHLLLNREKISAILKQSNFKEEVIDLLIWQVFDSPRVNRLFYEDYIDLMKRTLFEKHKVIGMWPRTVPIITQTELEKKHPGKKEFSYYGLRIIAEKKVANMTGIKKVCENAIFITGCGRSGTSCLAGLFDQGTYYLGDNLYPPSPSNPKGFYENAEINGINEQLIVESLYKECSPSLASEILSRFKPGQLWLALLPQNLKISLSPELRKAIRNLIERKPFCFKDPRFAYTVDAWLKEVPEALILCIFRDPSFTVDSILKECEVAPYLKGFSINSSYAFDLWKSIYLRLLRMYKSYNKIYFIHYHDLFEAEKLGKLEKLVGARLNKNFPERSISRSKPTFESNDYTIKLVYKTLCTISSNDFGLNREKAELVVDLEKKLEGYPIIIPEKWIHKTVSPSFGKIKNYLTNRTNLESKRMLVIAPEFPMYDRASGSLRLMEILKLLRELGHQLSFISFKEDVTGEYRLILQAYGIENYCISHFFYNNTYDVLRDYLVKGNFDFVIFEFWYCAEQLINFVKRVLPSAKIIIDSVDVHFIRETRMAKLYNDPNIYQQAMSNAVKEISTYKKAHIIWTVTDEDKIALKKHLYNIEIDVVPNIHEPSSTDILYENTSDILFIGNFLHSPNIDAVRFFHKDILPLIKLRMPYVKTYIVGNEPPKAILELSTDDFIVTGYVRDLSPYLARSRVFVAPLRYGAGMKGKIGVALSWGIPVVTTSIGAEGMGLTHGVDVLIADNPIDFANNVVKIYNDKNLWELLSYNGKNIIKQRYSRETVKKILKSLFGPT